MVLNIVLFRDFSIDGADLFLIFPLDGADLFQMFPIDGADSIPNVPDRWCWFISNFPAAWIWFIRNVPATAARWRWFILNFHGRWSWRPQAPRLQVQHWSPSQTSCSRSLQTSVLWSEKRRNYFNRISTTKHEGLTKKLMIPKSYGAGTGKFSVGSGFRLWLRIQLKAINS